MTAELNLDLPWVDRIPVVIEGLVVRRGRADTLTYDDGIRLEVRVLDPARFGSGDDLIRSVRSDEGPGRVVLIAGAVPLAWRALLRDAGVSFVDVSGVAEINWPRLNLTARRFGQAVKRQRSAVALQKGHALVAQELLAATTDGSSVSVGVLAEGAGVGLATASRAVSQLEEHGLVVKTRRGSRVWVSVRDRVAIANRLADRSAWPGSDVLTGYRWGRTVFDVAARISESAHRNEIDLAVTGRVGAAFLGVLGTSSPEAIRCWVDVKPANLAETAELLGLEPTSVDSANVSLCSDTWRTGVHRRRSRALSGLTADIADPIRVWCDLQSEPRGSEFAAQLWGAINSERSRIGGGLI